MQTWYMHTIKICVWRSEVTVRHREVESIFLAIPLLHNNSGQVIHTSLSSNSIIW